MAFVLIALNRRSVEKDEEVAVLVLDRDVVSVLEDHFAADLEACNPVAPAPDEPRPLLRRLAASLLRPLRREF